MDVDGPTPMILLRRLLPTLVLKLQAGEEGSHCVRTGIVLGREDVVLSLIHISEPTRLDVI
eukprot:6073733-Prorocentrum_lima.AAC.1